MFETTIVTGEARRSLTIPDSATDGDGLNFLSGKTLHDVNGMARLGTLLAHTEGGVPNICIMLPQISEYYMGQLIYFFEFACALSAGMMGVNPFNQPGVEAYKNNMFALLGKPGYDGLAAGILEKLRHKG